VVLTLLYRLRTVIKQATMMRVSPIARRAMGRIANSRKMMMSEGGTERLDVVDRLHYVQRVRAMTPPQAVESMLAMYSSALDSIVTSPSLMAIPIDDHGFHRGHAVFDTCNVLDGKAYALDMHIDRLLSSAEMAKIELKSVSKTSLKEILLATLAVAGKENNVFCRYWLTAGRGDFHVSPKGCVGGNGFYAVVHKTWERDDETPIKEVVVSTPLKPQLLANMKSNNYMINALTAMEAQEGGGNLGIQVDNDGYLQEASISCVGIVEDDDVLRTPPFETILPSTTVRRVLAFGQQLVEKGLLKGILQTPVKMEQVYSAKEAFLLGGHHVVPVGQVGERTIGNGQRGPVCKALQELQHNDMRNPEMTDAIPFSQYHSNQH